VDRLADAGVTAWLATAPPALVDADPLNSATNDRIAEYNEVVRTKITGAAAGPDFWTLFGVDEDGNGTLERVRRDLYGDSLHPTGLGHALMAAEWFNELAGDAAGTPLDPFFIDAISRNAYRQDLLAAGDRYLVDSAATVAALPGSLSAARWILPRQADAGATGASFLSFTLDRAATVHVAYDADASSLPGWLSGFGDTGLAVTTSATTYRVYARAPTRPVSSHWAATPLRARPARATCTWSASCPSRGSAAGRRWLIAFRPMLSSSAGVSGPSLSSHADPMACLWPD
jgi:hypothetical protein